MSLRARLGFLVALGLLLGLSLFGALAYLVFVEQQQAELSRLLIRELERTTRLLQGEGSERLDARFVENQSADFILQFVTGRDGKVVLPLGAETALPLYETPTLVRSGVPFRSALVSSRPWISSLGVQIGTIRLALDTELALEARRNLLSSLVLSGIIIALVTIAASLVILQRALRPLSHLASEARGIDPARPKMASYDGPDDEVAELARGLNSALDAIRTRQEAERASLAEIAHELAAPLTLVAGHLESLKTAYGQESRLEAAKDAANELLFTSQDLLTLARGELERPMDLEIFDLSEVLVRVARQYPGVTVDVAAGIELAGTPQRLTQLVRNLLRNAVQASGGTEEVRLGLESRENAIEIVVSDRGPGIAPEDLPHLFERFYTRRGGVGVGLSVAKRIAEQLGGDIRVTSSLGEGTRFEVLLPSLQTQLDSDA